MLGLKTKGRGRYYLHVICSISKQTSKGDRIGDCAQIDEQDGRQRLDVQRIIEVAGEKGQFPLHIQDEASTKPSSRRH